MGTYRLILAVLVLISHTAKAFFGYNVGVFAVVSFFLISGYVMTALVDDKYPHARSIPAFYMDRAIRLYPQFILYATINTAIIFFLLKGTAFYDAITAHNIAATFSMLPLGYYMFGASIPHIVPPAWSLGLELSFYLIFPAILIFRIREAFFAASVAVFMLAYFQVIDTDIYGYRLLPGTLFIFLCGSFMKKQSAYLASLPKATAIASALLFSLLISGAIAKGHHSVEVLAGIAFGIPAISILSKLPRNRFDEMLGNISYGVFLCHFTVIYLMYASGITDITWWYLAAVIPASIIMGLISFKLIEKPALDYRHRLRARNRGLVSLGGQA